MKKFSELNSINESVYVYRKEEVTFLLSKLSLDIDDVQDIFINFLDKGDHDFGINLEYKKKHTTSYFTRVDKEELNKDVISEINLVIYFQSKNYNEKDYYSNYTKSKGFYSKNEIELIEEYIFSVKTFISMIKNDNVSFNTQLEQLHIRIKFDITDEILDGLKKILDEKW
jgi:hypothetical protein